MIATTVGIDHWKGRQKEVRTMTNKEIDEMLDWCKKKMKQANSDWEICSSYKRLEGYEKAMLSVMSYLHSKKKG